MRKISLIIIITIFLAINANSENNNNFFIKLSYYSRPVKNKEWEIQIFKRKKSYLIKSIKFKNKNFEKEIPLEKYNNIMKKLINNGIWHIKKDLNYLSRHEFYILHIKSNKYENKIKIKSKGNSYGNELKVYLMIREIKNLCIYLTPDHI